MSAAAPEGTVRWLRTVVDGVDTLCSIKVSESAP